jgi:hypothetical protein
MFFNDHEQVIDLAATGTDVAARADAVREWMAATGWIGEMLPESHWDRADEPVWAMGPRARELFPQLKTADVSIDTKSPFWYTDGEFLAPECPNCATRYDQDTYIEHLEEWSSEPIGICPHCGFIGLFGDWDIKDSPLGGSLAVLIYVDTSQLSGQEYSDVVAQELRSGFGGRWANTSRHM